jgi:hypothetical protein
MNRTTRVTAFVAVALAAAARVLPAQFTVPPQSASIMPTAISRAVAAAPGETFSMFLSSTVQAGAMSVRDSTGGATQTYAGSVVLTPTWDLNNNRVVTVYAYVSQPFTSSSATISSSALEASAIGGTGSANGIWTAFAATVDGHSSGVTLTQVLARGPTKKITDASERLTVGLRLNTTNRYVEPGLYTGVVTSARTFNSHSARPHRKPLGVAKAVGQRVQSRGDRNVRP